MEKFFQLRAENFGPLEATVFGDGNAGRALKLPLKADI
jgi:hypothetical protein